MNAKSRKKSGIIARFLNIKKERPGEAVIADYGDEVIDGGDKGS